MAASTGGFTIPARIVVTVEGLTEVRRQMQKFASDAKLAGEQGQPLTRVKGGKAATVDEVRRATGAQLNDARQAAAIARAEAARPDTSKARRRELEGEIKALKQAEAQLKRYTAAHRTEGGKVLPPIYPTGELRFPSIAAQERGAQPKLPPRGEAKRPPVIPERAPEPAPYEPPAPRKRASRVVRKKVEPKLQEEETDADRAARLHAEEQAQMRTNAAFLRQHQSREAEERRAERTARRRADTARAQAVAQENLSKKEKAAADETKKRAAEPPLSDEAKRKAEQSRKVQESWLKPKAAVQPPAAAAPPPPPPKKPPTTTPPPEPPPEPPKKKRASTRSTSGEVIEGGQENVTKREKPERGSAEDRLTKANAALARLREMETAKGKEALAAEQDVIRATAQAKASAAEKRAADTALLKATAAEANARRDEANRIRMYQAGKDPGDLTGPALKARLALVEREQADRAKAIATRQATKSEIDAQAQLSVATRIHAQEVKKREAEIVKQGLKSGEINRGTFFQRLQSSLQPASGRLPEENLKALQFVGDKLQRSLGYAASGLLIGMGATAIAELYRDATELEVTFVRLKGQLEGIGQVESFASIRDGIREVAAETGQVSTNVAAVFTRMVGLSNDPANALVETASAMKLMTVTGLDVKSVLSSIVPISKAFQVSVEEIGDSVVEMGEKFGISEDDLLQFLGKTAVVAKQAGLGFEEVSIIGGTMANSLGKPIEASSEAINKVTGQLEVNMQKIFQILQANPETEGAISKMIGEFSQAKPGQALIELLKVVDKFDPSQKNQILKNVVSRREAEEFNALITNAGSVLQQLQDKENGVSENTGRLNKRFGDLKQTIQVAFQSINAAFESMGELLLRAGLGDALKDISNLLGLFVGAIGAVVTAFNTLNESIGLFGVDHLLSGFGRVITIMGLLTLGVSKITQAREAGVAVTSAESASEGVNTSQKEGNIAATEGAAVAQTNLNRSRAIGASAGVGAGAVEAGAVGAGAAAQTAAAARQAEMAASMTALTATGRNARLARSLPRMGANYTSQYGNYMAALASVPKAEIPRMTLTQRAFAGGKFLKVPAADALAATTGATTGLLASPLLTGAVFLVAAAYAKTQYDELARNAKAAEDKLAADLRGATEQNVREAAQYQSDFGERFSAAFTGTRTREEVAQDEAALMDSPARRRMTAFIRPSRSAKPTDTKDYLETTQTELNEQYAAQYSDDLKKRLQEQLMSSMTLAKVGEEAGVLEELPWHQQLFFDLGIGPVAAGKYKTREGGKVEYGKLRQAVRTYGESTGTTEDADKVKGMLEDIDAAESKMGGVKGMDEIAQKLAKGRDATGLIQQAGGDIAAAWNQATVWGDTEFKSINELNSMLEAGEIGEAEYVQKMKEGLVHLKDMGSNLHGTEAEAARIATREAERRVVEVAKGNVSRLLEFAATIEASSTLTPKTVSRDMAQDLLSKMPRKDRLEALPQMLQQDMAAQEEFLAAIPDPAERLAALNRGLQLTDLTKTTFLTAMTQHHTPATNQLIALGKKTGKDAETMGEAISKIAVEQNISMQEAALQYIDSLIAGYEEMVVFLVGFGQFDQARALRGKITELKGIRTSFGEAFGGIALSNTVPTDEMKALNDIESAAKVDEARTAKAMGGASGNALAQASLKAGAARRALERARASRAIKGTKTTDEDVMAAEGAAAEANIAEADAWFGYAQLKRQRQVVLANRDPVLETAAKMAVAAAGRDRARGMGRWDQAEQFDQEILQLQQEEAENQLNIVRGHLAVKSAMDAEDPFKSALVALQAAELELANAHGDADRLQKQAQVIQAQQALANAVSAGISADAELAISLANLRDDPVAAATLALQEAQRKLDEAKAKNITDRSVLAPLEDSIAQATKEAFLAPINKQIEDLDFLYGMEQISLSQYVAGLQAQLQRLQVNSKEYRDLALKIHNLQKQGEQDLQFNLPTTLGLPTLYEARRVTQSSQMGIGYQDNRNITMMINVNGAQDPMTITNQIVGALTSASGMTSTPLMGVGGL